MASDIQSMRHGECRSLTVIMSVRNKFETFVKEGEKNEDTNNRAGERNVDHAKHTLQPLLLCS